jgi:hypothetical protein
VSVPGPWAFALLTLAAFRIYRLIARDTITEPLRAYLTYPDASAVTLDHEGIVPITGLEDPPKPLRVYASTLIRCRWCLGAYVSAAVWGFWEAWAHLALVIASPFAIAAVLALVAKNLDP